MVILAARLVASPFRWSHTSTNTQRCRPKRGNSKRRLPKMAAVSAIGPRLGGIQKPMARPADLLVRERFCSGQHAGCSSCTNLNLAELKKQCPKLQSIRSLALDRQPFGLVDMWNATASNCTAQMTSQAQAATTQQFCAACGNPGHKRCSACTAVVYCAILGGKLGTCCPLFLRPNKKCSIDISLDSLLILFAPVYAETIVIAAH